MRKTIASLTIVTIFCAVFLLNWTSHCDGAEWVKNTKHTLRIGHCVSERFAYHLGCLRFAELAKVYTRGQVEIKIYPNFQLGSEQVQNKNVQIGTQDMALTAINNAAPWYPPLDIFIQPYIFADREHAFKVADGPIGSGLKEKFRKASGMRILALFEYGWRCVANNKRPIRKVKDFDGILIRVPKNPVMIDTFNALGAQATPIAWGETFNALQQGVVDAFDGTAPVILDLKFYEVIKYFSLTNHFYGFASIQMNEKKFQSLSNPIQEAILRAAREAEIYQRWVSAMQHLTAADAMMKKGVNVNKIEDLGPFRSKVEKVWNKYESKIGKEFFDAVASAR